MRLLGCFTKRPLVVQLPPTSDGANNNNTPNAHLPTSDSFIPKLPAPSSESVTPAPLPSTTHRQQQNPPLPTSSSSSAKFVPSSIPELHPEYAHSEPYCFVARTESARIVVDRMRGARGQPSIDHANILRQQGVTVVRGPSYSASKLKAVNLSDVEQQQQQQQHQHQHQQTDGKTMDNQNIINDSSALVVKQENNVITGDNEKQQQQHHHHHQSVKLFVERPSTLGKDLTDTDDSEMNGDENIDGANLQHHTSSRASKHRDKHSTLSRSRSKSNASLPKSPGPGSRSVRLKGRKSRQKLGKSSNTPASPVPAPAPPPPAPLAPPVAASVTDEEDWKDANDAIPIVPLEDDSGPCPDSALDDDNVWNNQTRDTASNSKPLTPSTPMNNKKSVPFETLLKKHMDNTPKELLAPIVVPRTSVVFGDNQRFADADEELDDGDDQNNILNDSDEMEQQQQQGNTHKSIEDQFPSHFAASSSLILGTASIAEESSTSPLHGLRARRKSKPLLAPMAGDSSSFIPPPPSPPRPTQQKREESPSSPSRSALASSSKFDDRERDCNRDLSKSHVAPLDVPRAALAQRRISTANNTTPGKRKTVSFHDAAPIIIEPNLRAPSQSLPRNMKERTTPQSIGSVLSKARDSVPGYAASPFVPLIDIDEEDDAVEKNTKKNKINGSTVTANITTTMVLNTNDGRHEKQEEDDDDEFPPVPTPTRTSFGGGSSSRPSPSLPDANRSFIARSNSKRVPPSPSPSCSRMEDTSTDFTELEQTGQAGDTSDSVTQMMGNAKISSTTTTMASPLTTTSTTARTTTTTNINNDRLTATTHMTTTMSSGLGGTSTNVLTPAMRNRAQAHGNNLRVRSSTARENSDVSYGSSLDASSIDGGGGAGWRGSRRVSARDKDAIRDATRRQSIAVAQAMSDQIRGVPRSAMLAYSQNAVIIEDDDRAEDADDDATIDGVTTNNNTELESSEADDNTSTDWMESNRRRSRISKSIRMPPEVKPGVVPPPPPPPPFSPSRLNVRSVRLPPPPPSSPLPH